MLEANLEKNAKFCRSHLLLPLRRMDSTLSGCQNTKTFELEEVRDNKNIAEVGENNK